MPKSRFKIQKSIITSAATIIGLSEELESALCCSQRNCPSHWQDRLAEKLKILQQNKTKSSSNDSNFSGSSRQKSNKNKIRNRSKNLPHAEILSELFRTEQIVSFSVDETFYSRPLSKSFVMEKHQNFMEKFYKNFQNQIFSFTKVDLQFQIQQRTIFLIDDSFSYQINRMENSSPLKINLLRINHVHFNCHLTLKIVSLPIWTNLGVHLVVQDENDDCLRLSIYNWSHTNNNRQIKSFSYVQDRLSTLLPMNSSVVLLDPWLKRCEDGDLTLRCESPNTNFLMIDFERKCSNSERTNIDQLRQWGNGCYQVDDNLAAIQFYTFALRQIDEQQEKQINDRTKFNELEQHRIRLLSNRCACYLRERQATLALADTSVLLSMDELSHVLESAKTTSGKLLFRCLSAHLHLGLFDKVENLLKSHQFGFHFVVEENSASIAILERELIRLKDEAFKGRFDLQGILREQVSINKMEKSPLMFIDLPHFHGEFQRNDLFEVRRCTAEEISRQKYPNGSFGVFALKSIEPGSLIVVEQPFASIDKRLNVESQRRSINFLKKSEKMKTIEFFDDETLRLINEIEKQLLIGNGSSTNFDKIKSIQPIRNWLKENSNKNRSEEKAEKIPWKILFETERENPFRSKSCRGWFSVGSMFNHSCLPNCLWYLIGDCLFIYVCASNIRQGDELTISYCPLWISSLNERTSILRSFEIFSCRCSLCSYDRSNMPQYEIELRKFSNQRALIEQEKLSDSKRFEHLQKLKQIYDFINKRYKQRPIGFVREFVEFEKILKNFHSTLIEIDSKDENFQRETEEFLTDCNFMFLQRFSRVCRFNAKDLPKIGNPIVLFGRQLKFLVQHLENCSTRVHSCDLKQWNRLLECLYEIFTFKCHSSSTDMQKTLKDHQQLFFNLIETQIYFD